MQRTDEVEQFVVSKNVQRDDKKNADIRVSSDLQGNSLQFGMWLFYAMGTEMR